MWFLVNHLVSPKKFFHLSNQLLPWLVMLFILSLSYGLIGGLILAQVLFSTFSELFFMDDVGNFMGRAGPVGIYLDRWMLIDV